MEPVSLNGTLLEQLIEGEFSGKVERFLDHWEAAHSKIISKPPDRSSIYRWMKGQLPRSSQSFLSLCGLLDVDPFAMLSVNEDKLSSTIPELLNAVQLRQWRQPALGFFTDFFGRQTSWPPRSISEDYFSRSWSMEDFEHDPEHRDNYYPTIVIGGSEQIHLHKPQVFHFAFRSPDLFGKRWLQYGFVERCGKQVRLVHINGHVERYETEDISNLSHVETWFGAGAAIFRIASLHPFSLKVTDKQTNACVRFPA